MIAAWHGAKIATHIAYIIGFPFDTPESVEEDVNSLKQDLGVEQASFFMLTPLPGSQDHARMVRAGEYMDPDLNTYDSFHETTRHPNFAPGEWYATYRKAWRSFYSFEYMRQRPGERQSRELLEHFPQFHLVQEFRAHRRRPSHDPRFLPHKGPHGPPSRFPCGIAPPALCAPFSRGAAPRAEVDRAAAGDGGALAADAQPQQGRAASHIRAEAGARGGQPQPADCRTAGRALPGQGACSGAAAYPQGWRWLSGTSISISQDE